MGDLKSSRLIRLKAVLFLTLGLLSSGLILLRMPDPAMAVLLCLTVWAFCRAYYFAFYVIEHYVDPDYRYAGLIDFLKYTVTRSRPPGTPAARQKPSEESD